MTQKQPEQNDYWQGWGHGYLDAFKRYYRPGPHNLEDKPEIKLTAGSSWQLWLWLAVLCSIPFLAGLFIGIGIGQG